MTYLLLLAAIAPAAPPAAQSNPFASPEDVRQGDGLFQTHCSYCHGASGEGGRGADLTTGRFRRGGADDDLFQTVRHGIPGSEMGPVRATDADVWRMVAFVKSLSASGPQEKVTGDPVNGKRIYQTKGGCAACHAIGEQGSTLGPDLTDIGGRRGPKFLEESLRNPEADLPVNYRAVRVVTASGDAITGVRLNEDDISIQIRDMKERLRSFLKDNLKEIDRARPSLMPAYGALLSQTEIEDLVAYLSTLRGER